MTTTLYYGCKTLAVSRLSSHLMIIGCATLATLFRFEGIVLLGLYFIWLLFHAVFRPVSRPHVYRGLLLYAGMLAVSLGIVAGLLLFGALEINTLKTIYQRFGQHYLKSDLFEGYRAIYDYLKAGELDFPGGQWSNDFFEIARHLMPVVYLLGLLQVVSAALFPIYLLPLCFGIWALHSSVRNLGLLPWTVLAYALMGYFFIMTRNFLSERYVLVVVVLLLPIVGHGFEQLRSRLGNLPYQKTAAAFVVMLFVVMPTYKTFAGVGDEKTELRLASEWLKNNRDIKLNRIATTDERVPFYAGLFREHYIIIPGGRAHSFDAFALRHDCSLIVVDVSLQDMTALPVYEKYALIKEFSGKKRAVRIYEKIE